LRVDFFLQFASNPKSRTVNWFASTVTRLKTDIRRSTRQRVSNKITLQHVPRQQAPIKE